jgi:hypothetical protein
MLFYVPICASLLVDVTSTLLSLTVAWFPGDVWGNRRNLDDDISSSLESQLEGGVVCTLCGKVFTNNQNARRHVREAELFNTARLHCSEQYSYSLSQSALSVLLSAGCRYWPKVASCSFI